VILVREVDIQERFLRSQGPGGQNVNKVSTCVYLRHIPTGIEVKCQQERSQAKNRLIARQILFKKIEQALLKKTSEERKRLEKMRRQKRKKPLGVKLRILEAKRLHSRKKSFRKKVLSEP
jgi:peptide chain release factor